MWHYCDPDDLIPAHHIYALMDQAARSLGNRALGLLVGTESRLATMGSFGRLIAISLTTYHAFETSCRLIRLHSSAAHHWLTEAGDEVWCCGNRARVPEAGRRRMEQYAPMRMIDHLRLAAGPTWRPTKVCLQTREAPERELREALGDPGSVSGRSSPASPSRARSSRSRCGGAARRAGQAGGGSAASAHGACRQLCRHAATARRDAAEGGASADRDDGRD